MRSLLVSLAFASFALASSTGCDAAAPAAPVVGPNAIEVTIKTEPAGATVMVDGAASGVGPLTLKINPGPHRLRATMNGYTASPDMKIQVGASEPKEHVLYLVASH